MDIRDIAKITPNNVKIVQRAVDEQAGGLCLPEQAVAITTALAADPTIKRLEEEIGDTLAIKDIRPLTAGEMRMIAAYALAAAAWLDMDAAERGEGNETL